VEQCPLCLPRGARRPRDGGAGTGEASVQLPRQLAGRACGPAPWGGARRRCPSRHIRRSSLSRQDPRRANEPEAATGCAGAGRARASHGSHWRADPVHAAVTNTTLEHEAGTGERGTRLLQGSQAGSSTDASLARAKRAQGLKQLPAWRETLDTSHRRRRRVVKVNRSRGNYRNDHWKWPCSSASSATERDRSLGRDAAEGPLLGRTARTSRVPRL
jgi:hypothetical protein